MVASVFNIRENTVQVLSNLSSAYEVEFMDAVETILDDDNSLIIIDFSAIHYISSTTIGLIVAVSAAAAEHDAAIKVIVTKSILHILTSCGIASMIDVEVV